MSTAGVVMLVFLLLATDVIVFWGIGQIVGMVLKPLAQAYPPVEPAPDAVTKRFQSFSFGMCNFGCGVHASVDDDYLHLTPVSFSKFFGLRPMSIPWGKIQPRPKPRFGSALKVRVGLTDITGPAWCLSLAGKAEKDSPSGNVTSTTPPGAMR